MNVNPLQQLQRFHQLLSVVTTLTPDQAAAGTGIYCGDPAAVVFVASVLQQLGFVVEVTDSRNNSVLFYDPEQRQRLAVEAVDAA